MSPARIIEVSTSSRLHFGLWAWGDRHERQFGGVGMMIREPRLRLRLRHATAFSVSGPASARVQRAAESCRQWWQLAQLPPCCVEVVELPPRHAGLGVGTQLALAIARGLSEWMDRQPDRVDQLALAAGRGQRSAVGTYGFGAGGLIVDRGKQPGEAVGQLQCRVAVPEQWRVVLAMLHGGGGLAGEAERRAFASLPPVPAEVSRRLQRLALDEMVPACQASDFDRFAAAAYEYGWTAGTCFQKVQGGPYVNPQVSELVEALRLLGAVGVGQSSWGPTVFAFAPDDMAADHLCRQLSARFAPETITTLVTRAANTGADVQCFDDASCGNQ